MKLSARRPTRARREIHHRHRPHGPPEARHRRFGIAFGMTDWFVYLLRCADGSLYAGITTDLARRVAEHNAGAAAARYTRTRRPVALAYHERHADRSTASRREHWLKGLSKAEKERLARG